jgi:hypothetical protein
MGEKKRNKKLEYTEEKKKEKVKVKEKKKVHT